jgi:inorganic pyrophosphatase
MYNFSQALKVLETQDILGVRRLAWDKTRLTITKEFRGLGKCRQDDMTAEDWVIVPKRETLEDKANEYIKSLEASVPTIQEAFIAGYKARAVSKKVVVEVMQSEPPEF